MLPITSYAVIFLRLMWLVPCGASLFSSDAKVWFAIKGTCGVVARRKPERVGHGGVVAGCCCGSSLLCARGNRGLAACGMLAATTILVLGVIAATRLGGADFPDVAQLAPALVAGIAMTCATAAGVPQRPARIE